MLKKIPWKFVLPALALVILLPIIALVIIGPLVGNVFSEVVNMAPPAEYAEPASGAQGELAAVPAQAPRLIIYTVDMSLVVADTEDALAQIESLADELEGYVTSSSLRQYDEGTRASITIRVPSGALDRALERLRGLALEVRSENQTGEDVTEEYVDLQARLEILEAAEQELLELYEARQASGEVADILEVYRQLVAFRQDIEALAGRIQYLEQSAALATITIHLTPDVLAQPVEFDRWRPVGILRNAFEALVRTLQFLASALIYLVVLVVPVLLVIAAPVVGLVYLVRAIRRRRARRAD